MKKNLPILIITFVLAAIAVFFLLTQRKSTVKEELKDFAISDTASVTKIFIADKQGHTATLQRLSKGKWQVNGKFIARREAVNTLLETMKDLKVRYACGQGRV